MPWLKLVFRLKKEIVLHGFVSQLGILGCECDLFVTYEYTGDWISYGPVTNHYAEVTSFLVPSKEREKWIQIVYRQTTHSFKYFRTRSAVRPD